MRSRLTLAAAALVLVAGLVGWRIATRSDHSCRSADLRTTLDATGHYDDYEYRLDGVRCADGFARADVVLTSVEADQDTALFRQVDERWSFVDAGTDLGTAEEHGVPQRVWDQLFR